MEPSVTVKRDACQFGRDFIDAFVVGDGDGAVVDEYAGGDCSVDKGVFECLKFIGITFQHSVSALPIRGDVEDARRERHVVGRVATLFGQGNGQGQLQSFAGSFGMLHDDMQQAVSRCMERISAYVSEGEPVGSVQKPVAPVVDVDGTAVFALDKLFAGVELSADEVAARRGEDGELSVREGYGGTVVHEQRAFVRRVIGGKEGFDAKATPARHIRRCRRPV